MRTIESLAFTIGLDDARVAILDRCRRKRHTAVYDQIDMISDHEAEEMAATAERLRELVIAWLRARHSQLLG